ncbi:hypothetical protein DENSPDRAFT_848575 [Dentipellis sp. KUC8613]|nr:hypothetical protein DENSPDRAFT_848575 [Dentipellis sp. KUC8613]
MPDTTCETHSFHVNGHTPSSTQINFKSTSSSGTPSNGESLEQIHDQIEFHEKALSDLKRRHNALAPVANLLPEILSIIFRMCVEEDAPHHPWSFEVLKRPPTRNPSSWRALDLTEPEYKYPLMAIRLSHVCRRWRSIARHDALLWTHILMPSNQWARRMLERSKRAPITVEHLFPQAYSKSMPALYHALTHLPRIRNLHISSHWQHFGVPLPMQVLNLLCNPAPALESLYLANLTVTGASSRTFPDSIFGGYTPRLTHLAVAHGVELSWTCPLLRSPNLTHLFLAGLHHWKSSPLANLLDVLDHMPHLQCLALHHCIPSNNFDVFPGQVVKMDYLTQLSLLDRSSDCNRLLAGLSIARPLETDVQLFSNLPLEGDAGGDLTTSFTQAARFAAGCKTVRLYVQKTGLRNQMRIQCWPCVVDNPNTLSAYRAGQSIFHFVWPNPQVLLSADVIQQACERLALENVEVLSWDIGTHVDESVEAWAAVLRWMVKVRVVQVSWRMLDILLKTAAHHEEQSEPGDPPLLPGLKKLVIRTTPIGEEATSRLKAWLAGRSSGPWAIESLDIADCTVLSTHIRTLRTLTDVVWDQMETNPRFSRPLPLDEITPDDLLEEVTAPLLDAEDDGWEEEQFTDDGE